MPTSRDLLNEFVASYTSDPHFPHSLGNPALPAGFPMGFLTTMDLEASCLRFELGSNTRSVGAEMASAEDTGYFRGTTPSPVYTYRVTT